MGPVDADHRPEPARERTMSESKENRTKESPKRDGGEEEIGGFGILDLLRVLGGVVLLNCALSWFITGNSIAWGYRPWWSYPRQVQAWWVRVCGIPPLRSRN
jgi:hypothetical protein